MNTNEESIRNQDYSHSYTTSVEHVLELYETAKKHKLEKLCELGSYQGISTVAMAYAAIENGGFVCAVDLCDEIGNPERVSYWQSIKPPIMHHIFPYKSSSNDFLTNSNNGLYDMIFHDSWHGDGILPELYLAWSKISGGGVLAVHDWEAISAEKQTEFVNSINSNHFSISPDSRGRVLAIFYK